jgi:hypothetical protein
MSDWNRVHDNGGIRDGDGIREELENRVRAALTARAEQVSPDSLRAGHPLGNPPTGYVRSRPPVIRRLAPLAVAVAVLVPIMVIGLLRLVPGWQSVPGGANTGATSGRSASVTLDGVTITVPFGWTYRLLAEGTGCVQPAGTSQVDNACPPWGVEIRVGTFVGWPGNSLDRDDGWALSQDCTQSGYADRRGMVTANRLIDRQSRRVAGRTAAYRVWQVRCDIDWNFTVRLWWLPDGAVTVYTMGLDRSYDATVDQLVTSMTVSRPASGASPAR